MAQQNPYLLGRQQRSSGVHGPLFFKRVRINTVYITACCSNDRNVTGTTGFRRAERRERQEQHYECDTDTTFLGSRMECGRHPPLSQDGRENVPSLRNEFSIDPETARCLSQRSDRISQETNWHGATMLPLSVSGS